jgi:hypothetical protein
MYTIRYPNTPIKRLTTFDDMRTAILTARMAECKEYCIVDETINEIVWDINDDIMECTELSVQ